MPNPNTARLSDSRNEYAIEIQGLAKRFPESTGWRGVLRRRGDKVTLDNIDLSVRGGQVFGLLGPNGSGKTTIMKVLAGLLVPTAGRVLVGGLDVVRESLAVRNIIGLVYGDERTFFWRLSLYENLRFYATLYRVPAAGVDLRIAELLETVGLKSFADTRIDRLSSGMKQRAAIARGLLNDPPILLMDEPTRMLDPIGAHNLRQFIRQRVADGRRTVLLATNSLEEAEEVCDEIALLIEGRIRLVGKVQELKQHSRVDQMNVLLVSEIGKERLSELSSISGVNTVRVNVLEDGRLEVELEVSRGSSAVPEAIRHIVTLGGDVWSTSERELTLQELFQMAVAAEVARPPKLGA